MKLLIVFCICSLMATAEQMPLSNTQAIFNEEEALALRRIADFWEEGEYQIAKSQMEEFLTEFPNSSYADTLRMALGDLFLREKSFQIALNYYAQISHPALAEQIPLKRMQCLYHLQWFATLADECEVYLQNLESGDKERLEATYFLAIALYQQCLIPGKAETDVRTIAERAKPYFETLSNSELSDEVAGAFAHLCFLLKDFEGASKIYLSLSDRKEKSEELLFQAAMIQCKYDKELALNTFAEVAELQGTLSQDAAYNHLVISFDLERYEEIITKKEELLHIAAEDRKALVHLFVGRSFLALNHCREAIDEFNAFLDGTTSAELVRPAFLHLLEAAFRAGELTLLDLAIDRLRTFDPADPNLPAALFSRAKLLKTERKFEEAKAEIRSLLAQFPMFSDREKANFEIILLEAEEAHWGAVREAALLFLDEYSSHELASYAWRYLAAASSELAAHTGEYKNQFVADCQKMLENASSLSDAEKGDLQFYLAKTHYELGKVAEAVQILQPLLSTETSFNERANAELILALSLRDGEKNEELFCQWAEKAISHGATLLSVVDQHLALFNSYLTRYPAFQDQLGHHLLSAFSLKANIELPNLLWLSHYEFERFQKDPTCAQEVYDFVASLLEISNPRAISRDTLHLEPLLLKSAKLLNHLGRRDESISQLQMLDDQYRTCPAFNWANAKEARYILAESLLQSGLVKQAESLFDEISSSVLRDRFAAKAALQSMRIKQSAPDCDTVKILSRLKDLVLQKNLENEPVHLEAALDYIELQSNLQSPDKKEAKRLELLLKTKTHFESHDDLLSKDYHAARNRFSEQNRMYLDYMRYFEAQILLAQAALNSDELQQKELQAKAEEILLHISGEIPLRARL